MSTTASQRLFVRAESLREQGFFERSARLYKRIMNGVAKRSPLWLDSCLSLASIRRSLGQTRAASRLVKEGLVLARRAGDADLIERFELESALVDRAHGRYRQSLEKLERFLVLFKRRKDSAGTAFILWATGGARRFSGDLKGAEADFLASLAAAKRARDKAGQAYALFGLGGITRIRGKIKASKKYYSAAGRILEETDDLFGKAYAHCGLANALRQNGEWVLAQKHYGKSHKLYSRLGDKIDLAYVDWGLGKLALQKGDFSRAASFLKRALAAFSRGGEARGVVLSEHSLAQLLHARGDKKAAEALFDKAVRRSRAAGLSAHLEIFT